MSEEGASILLIPPDRQATAVPNASPELAAVRVKKAASSPTKLGTIVRGTTFAALALLLTSGTGKKESTNGEKTAVTSPTTEHLNGAEREQAMRENMSVSIDGAIATLDVRTMASISYLLMTTDCPSAKQLHEILKNAAPETRGHLQEIIFIIHEKPSLSVDACVMLRQKLTDKNYGYVACKVPDENAEMFSSSTGRVMLFVTAQQLLEMQREEGLLSDELVQKFETLRESRRQQLAQKQ